MAFTGLLIAFSLLQVADAQRASPYDPYDYSEVVLQQLEEVSASGLGYRMRFGCRGPAIPERYQIAHHVYVALVHSERVTTVYEEQGMRGLTSLELPFIPQLKQRNLSGRELMDAWMNAANLLHELIEEVKPELRAMGADLAVLYRLESNLWKFASDRRAGYFVP